MKFKRLTPYIPACYYVFMKKITKTTTLKEIIEKMGAEEILRKNNVPCVSCPMAAYEIEKLEIGKVAEMYKLDLEKILKELNELK